MNENGREIGLPEKGDEQSQLRFDLNIMSDIKATNAIGRAAQRSEVVLGKSEHVVGRIVCEYWYEVTEAVRCEPFLNVFVGAVVRQ